MSTSTIPVTLPGVYAAKVYSISDPLHLGRIQMLIPQIYGTQPVQMWAPSVSALNGNPVPKVGTTIWCMFQGGDPAYPVYFPPQPPAGYSGQVVQQQSFTQAGGSAAASNTTYSSIYTPLTMTKRYAGTKLRVDIRLSAFVVAVAGLVQVAAQVAGVDTIVTQFFFNDLGAHRSFGGSNDILGVAVGPVTVQGRIRVGIGTMQWNIDANDWWTMNVMEVW